MSSGNLYTDDKLADFIEIHEFKCANSTIYAVETTLGKDYIAQCSKPIMDDLTEKNMTTYDMGNTDCNTLESLMNCLGVHRTVLTIFLHQKTIPRGSTVFLDIEAIVTAAARKHGISYMQMPMGSEYERHNFADIVNRLGGLKGKVIEISGTLSS